MKEKGIHLKALLAALVMAAILISCAHAASAQLATLPKYDVSITVEPAIVEPGAQARVTSHVTLLYYQMGRDPSAPDVYVEYEVWNRSANALVSSAGGGYTDEHGYYYDDIAVPKAPGEYVIIAKAYDVPGMDVNGRSEASFRVASAEATTPEVSIVPPPTSVPSVAPTAGVGGFGLGTTELLIIGAAILLILILILAAAVALVAFMLLRRKKAKPAEELPVAEKPAIGPARFCMHCGSPMPGEASSCPRCGLTPPSGVDTKQCASCGTVLPEAAKYCHRCGVAQEKK